jgi:hypothetical protein
MGWVAANGPPNDTGGTPGGPPPPVGGLPHPKTPARGLGTPTRVAWRAGATQEPGGGSGGSSPPGEAAF